MPLTFILHGNMFSAQNTFLRMGKRLEKEGKLMLKIYNCIHDIIILIHPAFSGT